VKRLGALALTVVCALAIGVSPAAGGTPTHLTGKSSYAFSFGYDEGARLGMDVQVQIGSTTFRKAGGLHFTIFTNMVFADFNLTNEQGTAYGSGCWLVPDSDFVLNSDLSATLTFDSSDPRVTECPGDPVGSSGLTTEGLVQNLEGPILINATWAPTSPVVSTRMTSRRMCKPVATVISVGTSMDVDAVASGPVSGGFQVPQETFAGNPHGFFGGVSVSDGMSQFDNTGDFCSGP
jgi:hypothetical protein